MKMKKKKPALSQLLLRAGKTNDFYSVQFLALRKDRSKIQPCQVRNPTSPDKVRIPELFQFLRCAEHLYKYRSILSLRRVVSCTFLISL